MHRSSGSDKQMFGATEQVLRGGPMRLTAVVARAPIGMRSSHQSLGGRTHGTRSESEWRMKTYLKLATLAMVLIAPAGVYAADSVDGPIGNHQEAQQEPQRVLD